MGLQQKASNAHDSLKWCSKLVCQRYHGIPHGFRHHGFLLSNVFGTLSRTVSGNIVEQDQELLAC